MFFHKKENFAGDNSTRFVFVLICETKWTILLRLFSNYLEGLMVSLAQITHKISSHHTNGADAKRAPSPLSNHVKVLQPR